VSRKWKEFRLGDLGDIITGRTPPSSRPECFGDNYPFITPSDMDGRKKASITARYLSEQGANLLQRNMVPAGSVAFSCIGWQMGKAIIATLPSFTNQQLNTIVPQDWVDSDFLYYSLVPWRKHLLSLGSATGVRTPILNKSAFSDLRLRMPDFNTQQKIAWILSAYDDLIENNSRRIKILQQIAQALYREWFVRPCQSSKVPKGWEKKKLADLVEVRKGKKPDSVSKTCEYGFVPQLLLDAIEGGVQQFTSPEGMVLVGVDDVVMVMDGARSGIVFNGLTGAIGSTLASFRPLDEATFSASLLMLIFQDRQAEIQSKNVGAAIPHANSEYLRVMEVPVPPRELNRKFHGYCEPLYALRRHLAGKNANLRRTRDLLLPKLISGEVDVSELDFETGERVA
jgi:type I restriction enzyme S subunit